jgi:hypothetical protein
MSSAPPPSSSSSTPGVRAPREHVLELEAGRAWRRRHAVEGAVRFTPNGVIITCDAILRRPLRLALGQLQIGAIDPGPARPSGIAGRFAVLRRLGPEAYVPQSEGVEGWLWTTTGGAALACLGDEDEAPNTALLFTKPLAEDAATDAFQPDFLEQLIERSPLGVPAVLGLLFRVAETTTAERVFKQFGLLRQLSDREIPPTLRRSLPTDRPADPVLRANDSARAATSVAPPGL